MNITEQRVRAILLSRDTRLLNILMDNVVTDGDPVIFVEHDVSALASDADVIIYDLDMIGGDAESIEEALSDLKILPDDKPLILIGSRAAVRVVANDALADKVARTMNKPLSFRQLVLAINSCCKKPVNDIPQAIKQSKQSSGPRLVVLSLFAAALIISAITFLQTEKPPLVDLPQQKITPPPPSISDDEVEISSNTLEIQKLNELAQLAFNEGRLIFPENNNVLSHLRQIEEYDSYNPAAHQIRNRLVIDLKKSFEQQREAQDKTNMNRVLSMIVELEPYDQEYADLLYDLENGDFSLAAQQQNQEQVINHTEDSSQTESQNQDQQLVSTKIIKDIAKPELENQEQQIVNTTNVEEESFSSTQNQQKPVESIDNSEIIPTLNQQTQERSIANPNLASIVPQSQRIEPAKIVKRVEPTYPRLAVDLSYEGWVELAYQVDEDGNAVNIQASQGKRVKTFEQAAIKAIKKWEFEPSVNLNTGSKVLSEPMKTTFHFSLD